MTRFRKFEVADYCEVNPAEIRWDYPHMIWPNEVGIDDPPIKAELVQFKAVDNERYGITLFRIYLLPEDDGSQRILTQHISGWVGPKMGQTALVLPANEKLVYGEHTICRMALERVFRVWRKRREA